MLCPPLRMVCAPGATVGHALGRASRATEDRAIVIGIASHDSWEPALTQGGNEPPGEEKLECFPRDPQRSDRRPTSRASAMASATQMAVLAHVGDETPSLWLDPMAFVTGAAGALAKVAVFAHGLMVSEAIWEMADGTDYGSRLAADLGYTPLYVRYNSGLAHCRQRRALSRTARPRWSRPIRAVSRRSFRSGTGDGAACSAQRLLHWPSASVRVVALVRRAIYIGTLHLGSPYERAGRVVASVLPRDRRPLHLAGRADRRSLE